MKKKILIFVLVLLIFSLTDSVKAYTCYYNYIDDSKNAETKEIDIEIDTENKTISSESFADVGYNGRTIDWMIDKEWTTEKIIDEHLNGGCESAIMVCEVKRAHQNVGRGTTQYWVLMNLGLSGDLPEDKMTFWINTYIYTYQGLDSCFEANLDSQKSEGNMVYSDYPCESYDDKIGKLKELACTNAEDFSTCSIKNVTSEEIDLYKETKDEINYQCGVSLKYLNYSNPCLRKCLNLSQEIIIIEGKSSNESTCGFSQKLIIWIANIVRWIKYIIPVAVIVLGILDFIKAVGADKDDEMKKAQGRFVKRLIAAALIFIVPFIIEFVLDKMGFAANGCGIIDL